MLNLIIIILTIFAICGLIKFFWFAIWPIVIFVILMPVAIIVAEVLVEFLVKITGGKDDH